jgi:hypothetical protein
VPPVLKEILDPPVFKVQLGHQGKQRILELPGLKDRLGHRVKRRIPEPPVHRAKLVPLVLEDLTAFKE